ncbi:MAG: Leucine rich repeat protein [Massilia sp.]|nr:Leucine rich repeat protein [Massilia sp.]
MDTTSFEDFSSALVFLKEMKVGVVSRSPAGDGFQWSAGDSQLDERQLFLLKAQRGDDAIWMDEETGLMWLFEKTPLVVGVTYPKNLRFAGHDDWRTPTVSDLKTLRGTAKNERGAYVKPTVPTKLTGAYSCSTAVRKGSRNDGTTWNFTTDSFGEVQYREGKIKWASDGGYVGFEKDSTSGEGAKIYVRGERSIRMSDWVESQISWAEENDYHNFPVTPDAILALETLTLADDKFPPYLSKLQSLRKIAVSECSTLPQELFLLEHLEELQWGGGLDHSGPDHCVLPVEVGNLSSLTSLILVDVKISALPQSIGELRNLKKLHVMRTNVGSLPESIGQLKNL